MKSKYNIGDLVFIYENIQFLHGFDPVKQEGCDSFRRSVGIIVSSHPMSMYDSMSNGKSTTTFQHGVMINDKRHSFFEEELDMMQQLNKNELDAYNTCKG